MAKRMENAIKRINFIVQTVKLRNNRQEDSIKKLTRVQSRRKEIYKNMKQKLKIICELIIEGNTQKLKTTLMYGKEYLTHN